MKSVMALALSTAAIGLFVSLTPAVAQVAGNPGDSHTRTLYMMESGQVPDQVAGGPMTGGPSFLVPSFLSPGPFRMRGDPGLQRKVHEPLRHVTRETSL